MNPTPEPDKTPETDAVFNQFGKTKSSAVLRVRVEQLERRAIAAEKEYGKLYKLHHDTNSELISEIDQLCTQLKESNTSHGKTLLMCEEEIKALRTRNEQLEKEFKEKESKEPT